MVPAQDVEDPWGPGRVRTVIEGQRNGAVGGRAVPVAVQGEPGPARCDRGVEDLLAHEAAFAADFHEFFPALQAHVAGLRL